MGCGAQPSGPACCGYAATVLLGLPGADSCHLSLHHSLHRPGTQGGGQRGSRAAILPCFPEAWVDTSKAAWRRGLPPPPSPPQGLAAAGLAGGGRRPHVKCFLCCKVGWPWWLWSNRMKGGMPPRLQHCKGGAFGVLAMHQASRTAKRGGERPQSAGAAAFGVALGQFLHHSRNSAVRCPTGGQLNPSPTLDQPQ